MSHLALTEEEKLKDYPYELAAAAYLFNRSDAQVRMLFELCDYKLYDYLKLEIRIKEQQIAWCPSDKATVKHILYTELYVKNKREFKYIEY